MNLRQFIDESRNETDKRTQLFSDVISAEQELDQAYRDLKNARRKWDTAHRRLRERGAANKGVSAREWTTKETALLENSGLTAKQVSIRTGRSISAVNNKRKRLEDASRE